MEDEPSMYISTFAAGLQTDARQDRGQDAEINFIDAGRADLATAQMIQGIDARPVGDGLDQRVHNAHDHDLVGAELQVADPQILLPCAAVYYMHPAAPDYLRYQESA